MKTKETKRLEATLRAAAYKWENSKAYRTGSKTRERWEAARQAAASKTAGEVK